jgi:hypothetical protein
MVPVAASNVTAPMGGGGQQHQYAARPNEVIRHETFNPINITVYLDGSAGSGYRRSIAVLRGVEATIWGIAITVERSPMNVPNSSKGA